MVNLELFRRFYLDIHTCGRGQIPTHPVGARLLVNSEAVRRKSVAGWKFNTRCDAWSARELGR